MNFAGYTTEQVHKLVQSSVDKKVKAILNKNETTDSGGSGNSGGGTQRKCFKCKSTKHLAKDCPKKDSDSQHWRTIKPADGEPTTKVVGGKTYHWCPKCGKGRTGRWVLTHTDETHVNGKNKKEISGNLALIEDAGIDPWLGE